MRYYFIGICGVSMSSLACFAKSLGHYVSGSDISDNENPFLKEKGIPQYYECNIEEVKKADIVVVSSAIHEDNSDLQTAKRCKKKIISRGEMLGKIASGYEYTIAVAGSHGKTTTTALIYNILKAAGEKPTLHLGGTLAEEKSNYILGEKKYFVTEACEYHDNFLFLFPYLSVITNIEKEHMDYFKTFENELKSFKKFASQSKFVIEGQTDIKPKNIRHKNGKLCFDIVNDNIKIMSLRVNICEDVNAYNCVSAYRACKLLGISNCAIKNGLENFKGVKLRFEKVRCKHFKDVILDYAHHPTEIKNTIRTTNSVFKNRRKIFIFQPHTYSRTKNLLKEFEKIFQNVNLVLYKTYPAREKKEEGVSAKKLAEILKKTNKNVKYCENYANLMQFLFKNARFDDVLVFVGAGDLPNILYRNHFLI